jgi:hypothetical protein
MHIDCAELNLLRSEKERILSGRTRRIIAVGMLVLLIIVSAVGFYSRESRTVPVATTVASEVSHPHQ